MAFLDNDLLLSSGQAITGDAASSVIYDITGAGSGNAPAMTFGVDGLDGSAVVPGADMGTGDGAARPTVLFTVNQAFVSGGGATVRIQIQAAPDNGSNSPGSYYTIVQTDELAAADLPLGAMFNIPLPPIPAGEDLPRFYRVYYEVTTSTFSAGKITAALMLNPPTLVSTLYPGGFASV